MGSRRCTWCLLVLAGLAAWAAFDRREQARRADGDHLTRPPADAVVRAFGGGPSDDPERDAALRRQVVGRWGRSDSDRVYLDFAADGGLRGADMASDPVAVARGEAELAVREYAGRWEIHKGWVRLHTPDRILAIRLRFTEDGRLQLCDTIERIDQAWVYRRLP